MPEEKDQERVMSTGLDEGISEKPRNAKRALGRMLKYFLKYKTMLVFVFITVIISSLCSVAVIYLLKPILNDFVLPFVGQSNPDMTNFLYAVIAFASLSMIGVICNLIYNILLVYICNRILMTIRMEMFTHMQDLPIKYYDERTHGEVMSRYSNDIDALREMISQGLPQTFSAFLTVIGVFVLMLILSWALTLIVVAMLLVILLIVYKIGGKSARYFNEQQKELGNVNGYIEEIIEGQKVVKVFCHEEKAKEVFSELSGDLQKVSASAHGHANMLMPIAINISNITIALIATIGAVLSVTSGMDLGTVASFIQATRAFNQPISQIAQQINSILTALAGCERIFDLIDEPVENDDGQITLVNVLGHEKESLIITEERTCFWAWKVPEENGYKLVPLKGDVRLKDVTFEYVPGIRVLNNVSLFAKPGQKIALVGSTGAGKTTITNLLNRFYDVEHGEIIYDGINIKNIKKDDLRRSLGMVLQDVQLFGGTIRENIRYGNLNATDEDVENAAKLSNADSFITHLQFGYDTQTTSSGTNLSQGQRQLISIARAAVSSPPVLILDEATSSIDTRTEALIEKGMDSLMNNRTVFVIAHRLSTVRNADAIIVLEHGKIIERGNHDELLQMKGKYYQLYTGAFELD